MNGWVKFHRQIVDWRWYQDANTFRLFFHLVLTANHEPKEWTTITIDRGQRVTSKTKLAAELGLSVSQIRTALRNLQLTGEIILKPTKHYTIVTVCNYAVYQAKDEDIEDTDDRHIADTSQTHRRRIATNKNDKNDKNSITTPTPSSDAIPYEAIMDAFNSTCSTLPKVQRLNDARRKAIRARWNEYGDLDTFRDMFTRVAASAFLSGGGGWKASFDWLMKPGNFVKVLEGNYDNRKGVNGNGNQGAGIKPIGYYEHHEDSDYDKFYAN